MKRTEAPPRRPRKGAGRTRCAPAQAEGVVRTVTVVNRRGLHARAAAKFVKLAAGFEAEINVAKDASVVSALSIMGLIMLAAGPGCRLEIRATGPQAPEAVEALANLVEGKFAEDEDRTVSRTAPSPPRAGPRRG